MPTVNTLKTKNMALTVKISSVLMSLENITPKPATIGVNGPL